MKIMKNDISKLYEFLSIIPFIKDKRAKKYFQFGFLQRANQIVEIRYQISELIKKAGKENLSPYEVNPINIFINSFYINLVGVVDNLAWTLQHEYNLIEGAEENNAKRNSVLLFSKRFQAKLEEIDSNFIEELNSHKNWFFEIKEFRDPAAHRMPLYCPPGVLNDKQYNQRKEIEKDLTVKSYRENYNSYQDSIYKLQKKGSFQPIFVSFSESRGDTNYPLLRTVIKDYEPFMEVANFVCNFIKFQFNNSS